MHCTRILLKQTNNCWLVFIVLFYVFQNSGDDREVENQLVMLLGVDAFEFIKIIRQYRQMSKSFYMHFWSETTGSSCSKLTMSLVNDLLKFTSSDVQKLLTFFLNKKYQNIVYWIH